MMTSQFRKIVWDNYKKFGRHDLPWRKTRDPYKILISEVMLQQTQVARVEGYYKKFIKQFPDFRTLARAKTESLLRAWQGLGYNRRALLLKKLAEEVVEKYRSKLPKDRATLESLPGIGKGTSGALRAFAFNKQEVFIETNIRRVFIHFFFRKRKKVTDVELIRYIERSFPTKNNNLGPREWYWALMDYGSALPRMNKNVNPNRKSAHYMRQGTFRGSRRELRGKVLRVLLMKRRVSATSLQKLLGGDGLQFQNVILGLLREGFIVESGKYLEITRT